MRPYERFMITAAACLLAVSVSGPAKAQETELGDIIVDYCEKLSDATADVFEEFENGNADLLECQTQYLECLTGPNIGDPNPSRCFQDYARCIKRGNKDQLDACEKYLGDVGRETLDATEEAANEGVLTGFLAWFYSDESADCLDPVRDASAQCAAFINE